MAAKQAKQCRAVRELYIDQLYSAYALAQSAITDKSLHPRLEAIHSKLEDIYEEFEKTHISLINTLVSVEGSDLNEEKDVRTDFLEKYYCIKETYNEIIQKPKNAIQAQATNHSLSQSSQSSAAKLPKINVPIFDGNYTEWTTFIDMYNSLVHNDNSIDKVRKYNYLISSLKNEPLAIVKALPVTEVNYDISYNALTKRYQNDRLLSNTYWSKIVNSDKLLKESASGLRKLLNTFTENLAALKLLKLPVDQWDFVMFNILIKKLDSDTVKRFELSDPSSNIPSYTKLTEFLDKQCTALESAALTSAKSGSQNFQESYSQNKKFNKFSNSKSQNVFVSNTNENNSTHPCIYCTSSTHYIYTCPDFLSKSPFERSQIVRQNNWCTNCLHSAHVLSECTSKRSCRFCKFRHNSLIHYDRFQQVSNSNSQSTLPQPQRNLNMQSQNSNVAPQTTSPQQPAFQSNVTAYSQPQNHILDNFNSMNTQLSNYKNSSTVLLATAQAEIKDKWGNFQPIRILIENCSQINIITQNCAARLGLPRSKTSLSVFGVGQAYSQSSGLVQCSLRPKNKMQPVFQFDSIVLPKICLEMPSTYIPTQNWTNLSNIQLADPNLNKPSNVDLLLGAEMFPHILEQGFLKGNDSEPTFINTVFGWIALGKVALNSTASAYSFFTTSEQSIEQTLKRFWELEQVPESSPCSEEDLLCEEYYSKTTKRDDSGRYTVSLPFKENNPIFPGSKSVALRRFISLEKRLIRDPQLYKNYSLFMKEYVDSNYMELISESSTVSDSHYYIPHHCVVRPDSVTTKLRVVMDASATCDSGFSLNDTLMTGSKLQKDLTSILLRFRTHVCCFTADIKQMYSQIRLSEKDIDFQRLFWRFSADQPIQTYRLLRVSFGVKSSPFLALRTIEQLVSDDGKNYPLASEILSNDIFVDDIVSGFSSLTEAISARNQLDALLKGGGFELRKWTSNNSHFLKDIPKDNLHQNVSREFDSDESLGIKILGLKWNPKSDCFSYLVEPLNRNCTKRTILSEVARTYDPLGFLSPLTFFAKHLIQHLWTLGLEWDQSPPQYVLEKWEIYKRELPSLSKIQIPRFLFPSPILSGQLHGFADSSEKGYGAVIYFRSQFKNDFYVNLVCAKSRVSPLKRISLPRLELCAALLLADLLSVVLNIYQHKVNIQNVFAWSDSTVTLSWIKGSPHRWTSFVSNRVTRIQEKISPSRWFHVKSEDNSADIASRGLLPSEIISCSQWWNGPYWLKLKESEWPKSDLTKIDIDLSEEERKITLASFVSLSAVDEILNKYSSLAKIQKIIALVLRFIYNLRNPATRKSGSFIASELHEALLVLVKRTQHICFSEEINNLNTSKPLSKPFRALNPFIGEDNVLRVGGRLVYSGLSYDRKFPALLPKNSRITDLIIEQVHKENLHPGPQTLQFLISQRFWILAARQAIRRVLSRCIKCFKLNPTPITPYMGNLPSFRVCQAKPFSIVGVDFGGPFMVTMVKSRGVKSQKAYICLFVCATVKAVHIELASDLSTETFLGCLRRFIARRGRCVKIFSDQGTNFVGASNELQKFNQLMQDASAEEKIEWCFNPPSSPHFGGLFEAGIKSAKSYLLKVIGLQVLTFEELSTVLCQVEAVLNSRPLISLSSDPSDLSVLTPGHFLTLEPLTSLPEPDLQSLPLNYLSRWQLVQRLHQDFWKRWHGSYLNTLQQRTKWTKEASELVENSVVIIKNDTCPPLTWKLGKIVKLHYGKDKIARVATVRTATGTLQRPLVKLCPLPSM